MRAQTPLAWVAVVAAGRGLGVMSTPVREFHALADFGFGFADFDRASAGHRTEMTLAFAARAGDPSPLVRELLRYARTPAPGA
ncbi:hypothetical protein SRB17_25630 [Streptomyces sp. RB17]|uniref:hypothetical protein n=1 Tax=Streptomyces sp. RB17 TaxID=2585197 RepID=UPI001296F020|nr:hypothetical protein [Streptomyces sp. RB17]MQY34593.1 hypothetical protein [Streptomyces sp. RB17]